MDSGWETWLHVVADELVANKSFAELLRTNASRAKIENSLKQLRSYDLYPKALELPGGYINVPGMQEIKIQIERETGSGLALTFRVLRSAKMQNAQS